jgi:AAA15 family ATPase/GTPase
MGIYGKNNSGKTVVLDTVVADSSIVHKLWNQVSGGLRIYGKKLSFGLGFDNHNTAYMSSGNDILWEELDI